MVVPKPEELKDFSAFDDSALIKLIAAKQPEALEVLYKRYGGFVYRDTEDAINDSSLTGMITIQVFLYVWENASQYPEDQDKVSDWLCEIERICTAEILSKKQISAKDKDTGGLAGEEPLTDAGKDRKTDMPCDAVLPIVDPPKSLKSKLMHEVKRRKSILLER